MSFIQDLNTLAGSLSGAAQSLTGLYQTRTALERDRLKSQLRVLEDELLARTFLPEGDQRKISVTDDGTGTNWRDALAEHRQRQEEMLGDVRWKRVAGSVRAELDPEVSGFNRRFGEAMYAAERRALQGQQIVTWEEQAATGDISGLLASRDDGIKLFDDVPAAYQAYKRAESEGFSRYLDSVRSLAVPETRGDGDNPVLISRFERQKELIIADENATDEAKLMKLAELDSQRSGAQKQFRDTFDRMLANDAQRLQMTDLRRMRDFIQAADIDGTVPAQERSSAWEQFRAVQAQTAQTMVERIRTEAEAVPEGMMTRAQASAWVAQVDGFIRAGEKAVREEDRNNLAYFFGTQSGMDYANDVKARINSRVPADKDSGASTEAYYYTLMQPINDLAILVKVNAASSAGGVLEMFNQRAALDNMLRTERDDKKVVAIGRAKQEVDKYITEWETKGGDKVAWLMQMQEKQGFLNLVNTELSSARMSNTTMGKLLGEYANKREKASKDAKDTYYAWMNDISMHMDRYTKSNENLTPAQIQSEAVRYTLTLSRALDASNPQARVFTERLFRDIPQQVAPLHGALEQERSPVTQGTMLAQLTEQRDATVNQLINLNREKIPGSGRGTLVAQRVGNDLQLKVGGVTYDVDASGDSLLLTTPGKPAIRLETQAERTQAARRTSAATQQQNAIDDMARQLLRQYPDAKSLGDLQIKMAEDQRYTEMNLDFVKRAAEMLGGK